MLTFGLSTRVVFGTQVVTTLALFGLIWFVQVVHYPLLLRVPPSAFAAYEAQHANRTGYVAGPLMIAELLSAVLLLNSRLRPTSVPQQEAVLGLIFALLAWASTFWLQVPLHNTLHGGFSRPTIERLIATNWLRTALWTLRAALITRWVLRAIPS